jgi:hypothetical protein
METLKNSDRKIGAALLISSFIISHVCLSLFANAYDTNLREETTDLPTVVVVTDTLRIDSTDADSHTMLAQIYNPCQSNNKSGAIYKFAPARINK